MTKTKANEEAMRAASLDFDTFGSAAVIIGDDGVWEHVPLNEVYAPAAAEIQLRRHGDGLPDVTELGEPVAVAMFSDRYADVEHMPREVQSDSHVDRLVGQVDGEEQRAAWMVLGVLLGAALISTGLLAAGVLFLGWWR